MGQQLPLGMTLGSDRTFDTLVTTPNAEAFSAVRTALNARGQFIFLWGNRGSGRSHLLQALVRDTAEHSHSAALLPLADHADWQPEILDGWDRLDVVALDDVDAIAGEPEWERAIFTLFNALRDAGGNLLVSAASPPGNLDVQLPDLRSRFGSMLVYQWRELDDAGRLAALQAKARARGMELSNEVGAWLLSRQVRDMHTLTGIIEQLDHASLAAQRRLTIPFIREILEG